jgi:predicted lipoprotein
MITWRKLNSDLSLKTEEQVLSLLNKERATGKRITVLERLHQRYNTLRVARERVELLKEATK